MTDPEVHFVEADLATEIHQRAVVDLTAAFAQGPYATGQPLDQETLNRLLPGLRALPTVLIILAVVDQRPIGLAICFRGFSTFQAKPLLNVHDLMVLPEFRGRGIGAGLLTAVHAKARSLGCCRVTLEVHEHNAPARQLYEGLGYVRPGCRSPAGCMLFYSLDLSA